MEKEQSNDLYQEPKHDQIQRILSDNFNLTGLSKNQAIPLSGVEKFQSNNMNYNFRPEISNCFGNQMIGYISSVFEDSQNQNNITNIFKSLDFNNNSFLKDFHNQLSSSFQDLNYGNANGSNEYSWMDEKLLGQSFPQINNQNQPKANQQPLQVLDFQRTSAKSSNNNSLNNILNNNSLNNNNLNNSNNNLNNNILNNNSINLNNINDINNIGKSINGFGKGINSSNSNFNLNFNLQNFSRSILSNDFQLNNFNNPIPSGFGLFSANNDCQQNKESLTNISSSSSSSRTHSNKRGTTIIISQQQNNGPNTAVKQSSDSFQQENGQDQQDFNNKKFIENDQLGQKVMRDFSDDLQAFLLKNYDQNMSLTQLYAQKLGKENTQVNQLQDNFNSLKPKIENDIKLEEDENVNSKNMKKSKLSKKQNLKNEEKESNKKLKTEQLSYKKNKAVDMNCNNSDETQGLNSEDNIKSAKQEEQNIVKKEQMEDIENNSAQVSSGVKPSKFIEKAEGQEKKSSSRQSQHKNVYKNFGKELLRFVRNKGQNSAELTQEEFRYLLDKLTGGLNEKDTKQTLPIQKKEKLQMLWTLKQETVTQTSTKKQKNDQNKNEDDKQSEYYFINEKEDEITNDDDIDLKTKKVFRKISWEFFDEWAFQYVMGSRKLDKKEIHLKCIPSFLFGIMCPKSLEVFKPIREHDRVFNKQAN